jgi:hypothetical protein
MAQEYINVGASANDGDGDPLRTAFIKTNNNFSQLFEASTGNLTVTGNIVGGNIYTEGDISAQGQIQAAGNIVTLGYFLGNFAGNVTGNFTAAGSNTQVLFNGNGTVSADAGMTYSRSPNVFTILGTISSQGNTVAGNLVSDGRVTAVGNIIGAGFEYANGIAVQGSGAQGTTGTQGTTGAQGFNGSLGSQGTVGSQGTTGVGIQGTTGAQGTLGNTGAQGVQGISGGGGGGAQGTTGAQGATGAGTQGTTGAQGATGNPFGGGTFTGNITTQGILPAANVTYNIGSSSARYSYVYAVASSALYADLAECYLADCDYPPGTVLSFGGNQEVTMSTVDNDSLLAGVVSTAPAYQMNDGLKGDHVVAIALVGRVPCVCLGPVRAGDFMVSDGTGKARPEANPNLGAIIGKAIKGFDGDIGVTEILVGRF